MPHPSMMCYYFSAQQLPNLAIWWLPPRAALTMTWVQIGISSRSFFLSKNSNFYSLLDPILYSSQELYDWNESAYNHPAVDTERHKKGSCLIKITLYALKKEKTKTSSDSSDKFQFHILNLRAENTGTNINVLCNMFFVTNFTEL